MLFNKGVFCVRRKNEIAVDKILDCAKEEFMEKGFEGASMRTIAERAGYTTGMLYARFADKSQLFKELVDDAAEKLFRYFSDSENAFADLPPEQQLSEMHTYVEGKVDEMIDIIYDRFDAFKLIVCKSAGSGYEYYIDKMIDVETANTLFIDALKRGHSINDVRADLAICCQALCLTEYSVVATICRGKKREGISNGYRTFQCGGITCSGCRRIGRSRSNGVR
ncbi:MAG: TetR/AcrR family transcriptional regulator [Candidatus Borkfalkia sp.]